MSNITNPLDILKRLDVKQNVTIRIIDEPTGQIVQEHIGHNAATNSLLTGIAHYLMGDGVLNQGKDTLSMWVPQYISLGTMGLTSQESETIVEDGVTYIVPKDLGYTPAAPNDATAREKELNARLRFEEYLNQTPGFGADGYDDNSNNDREWFGLGYPYSLKPDALKQNFYTWDGTATTFTLSETPIDIISVTLFQGGEVDQDPSHTQVSKEVISSEKYSVSDNYLHMDAYSNEPGDQPIPANSRIAVIYTFTSADAANCELVKAELSADNIIVPLTLRSKITYRDMIPEYQSEVPNTLDVVYSAMISTGALSDFRGGRDYIYLTEAGLWSNSAYTDSGDNGMLAGYRIMPSDDEVNILGVEFQFVGTGEAEVSVSDPHTEEPLSIVSIDSISCDYTLEIGEADGISDTFTLIRPLEGIYKVFIDGIETDDYTEDVEDNTITFTSAPAAGSEIKIFYVNDVIPKDEYSFEMLVGDTVITFNNGYIPAEASECIMVYRTGDATGTWKDMTIKSNREKVQKSILRIGTNQVAQVVWKIQLGGLEQLNGLRYLYPSQYPEEVWEVRV